ncbi:hypothetical protein PIIN_04047 [Serendipita indica DSM 11827]|uniref:Transmembrane protein 53-B n=1 Tax=Serendipita indica (strain DSM 11827) TaxID=1109443 RepID=G4TFJ2_SERID|nr:hypothetical protein PIIN_04047 [Serendipita indica DSM 11827]
MSTHPDGFIPLGHGAFLVKGTESSNELHPTLVLIFGWMDGKLAHVAKFSALYKQLFPSADQIVVASTNDILWRTKPALDARVQPIVDQLIALDVVGPTAKPHRILTHTFSNGGNIRLDHLSSLLKRSNLSVSPQTLIQPSAFIIDSAPGGDNLTSALHTFRASIPSPFLRYPTLAILLLYYWASLIVTLSTRRYFDPLRDALLSRNWVPWITSPAQTATTPTQWLFIYSKSDVTVPYQDVDEMVARATSKGLPVHTQVYNDTAHVSHFRQYPDRYTQQVLAHWQRAMASAQKSAS